MLFRSGLATVYAVVQRCGGTVEVRSAPGRGSRFRLSFPRGVAPEPQAATEGAAPPPPEARRFVEVLVVDDEAQVRMVLGRLLRSAGFGATERRTALEALEALEAAPDRFDVLLADLGMPERDGAELVEEVRRRFPRVRCVLMSAAFAEVLPAARCPDVPRLHKPFDIGELRRLLERTSSVGA